MRLIKFLNEDPYKEDIEEIWEEYIFEFIKDDCKPFLNIINKGPLLYRGMYLDENFYKVKVDKNRKPRDNPISLHKFLDLGYKQVFGKPLRTISTFGNGSISETWKFRK